MAEPPSDLCMCGHQRWAGVRAAKWVGHFEAGMGACRYPGCSCKAYRHWKTKAKAVRDPNLRHVTRIVAPSDRSEVGNSLGKFTGSSPVGVEG